MRRPGLLILAALLMAATAFSAAARAATLDVTIAYRERIALPPDAVVEVELLDVSRLDAPAERLSSQRFRMTAVPFAVTLAYDPDLIDPRRSYTVSARILSEGKVVFRTTQAYGVLTRGGGAAAALRLERMPATSAQTRRVRVESQTWQFFEIAGRDTASAPRLPAIRLYTTGDYTFFDGCNYSSGLVTLTDDRISFRLNWEDGYGDPTLVNCPPEFDDLAGDVHKGLRSSRFELIDGVLVFTDDAGTVTLKARRQ